MLAMGSVLAGTGVLLVALLALLCRHPRAPRWAGSELLAMMVSVPVTVMIGFGLGHVLHGGYQVLHGGGGVELFAPVAVAAALLLLIPPLRRRIRTYAATSAGPAPLPAAGLSIDPPPRAPSPARPPTRKAA